MTAILAPLALVTLAAAVGATDATSVLESARAKQVARWSTVDNYTVTLAVKDAGGLQTPVYYEKMKVKGQATFRMVSPAEYTNELSERAGFPPGKDVAAGMAPGLDMLGDALATGGGDMPPMDLRGMTSQMSMFARAAATAEVSDGRAEAADALGDFAEFARRARLAGTEKVAATSGEPATMHDAYRLVADDVSDIELEQPKGDAKFTLQKVSLWLDKKELVPLRLLMEGEVEQKGKKTPLTIEKLDLDYKQVGPLYESHHQVYRLAGMMAGLSEKDRKEMEKAKAEFEKAKAQMASLPPDQKAMVEKMMKGQMEKFEAMTSGDAVTSTTEVVSIAINEGPPTPFGPGSLTVGGPAAATYPVALTLAADGPDAELAIGAQGSGGAEATIGLVGTGAYPQSGEVAIRKASGHVALADGTRVSIESGTGTITVTGRTRTRIVGTFTALLTGQSRDASGNGGKKVSFSASGTFDSGAPAGAHQALRGSPIPADLFDAE